MVSVTFTFPKELSRNPSTRQALINVAEYVRDLWLARAPYATGEYAKGLLHPGSIKVADGQIVIKNLSRHAGIVEFGFKAFNLGLAILRGGKGVKTAADGSKYKVVNIKPSPQAAYRKQTVAQQVTKSYTKLIPLGMKPSQMTRIGTTKQYEPRRSLRRPLKGKAPKPNSPQGIFTISEKAIRENPQKWMMPSREGKRLAQTIQKEAKPIVVRAMQLAVQTEKERQMRVKGQAPKWYNPSMKSPLKVIPVRKSGVKK